MSQLSELQLKIYNTLTKQKETFVPAIQNNKNIGIYVCGNTVYDFCHVGNARVFVFFDVVVRYLRTLNYNVTYVRNITDIDDKIIKRAQAENVDHSIITTRFTTALHEDLAQLNIIAPTHEPKVTLHLPQIIALIQTLIDKDYAYVASNGDVYYATNKFKTYGELVHQDLDSLRSGARIDINAAKRNPLDFVLWKMAKPGEPAWPSPWGTGRPGWHIECSAMAQYYLGNCFDIHGGGADLQFPHHQNEIAQSEAACACKHVKYWMHVGFVSINNEKMSKSLGNFFTVREVLEHYHPEVLRYFLLTAHYRSPLNYSPQMLDAAKESLTTLYTALRGLDSPEVTKQLEEYEEYIERLTEEYTRSPINENSSPQDNRHWHVFITALSDDFNIPLALSYMFKLANIIQTEREERSSSSTWDKLNLDKIDDSIHLANIKKHAKILRDKMGAILGILQCDPEEFFKAGISNKSKNDIQQLIDARTTARQNKDWAKADQIRQQLSALEIILEDTASGTIWRKS